MVTLYKCTLRVCDIAWYRVQTSPVTHQEYGVEQQDATLDHFQGAATPVVPLPIIGVRAEDPRLVFGHFSSFLQFNFIAALLTSICRR